MGHTSRVGAPTFSLYDKFSDAAGGNPAKRDLASRKVGKYGKIPTKWELLAGTWTIDGNGYANAASVTGDTSNILNACLVAPCGTAGDRRLITVSQGAASLQSGAVIASDGRYFIKWKLNGTNTIQIQQTDTHAFAPTYSSTPGNAWTTLATSASIPGYNASADNEFVATLIGNSVTVAHSGTGTSISATVSVPIGSLIGLCAKNSSAKYKSIKCVPIGRPTFADIGNGVELVDFRVIQWTGDSDGVSIADTDADGIPDLISYNVSSNGNGVIGGTYKAQRGPLMDDWSTTAVSVNSSISVTDKWTGLEGNCVFAANGGWYAFVHDTPSSGQWIVDLATGNRMQISTYVNGQDCRPLQISGVSCLVSTHEGSGGGANISNGGIVGYHLLSGDPLTLSNWTQFTIARLPGTWGFQKSDFGFVDLDGGGLVDILVSARDSDNATVTAPGLYSVKMPVNPFAVEWALTARYLPGDGQDISRFDIGDFSGDGNGLDAAFVLQNGSAGAFRYLRKSTGTAVTIATVGLSSTAKMINVGKMPSRGSGARDGLWGFVDTQGFYSAYYDGAAWQTKCFHGAPYSHGAQSSSSPAWNRADGTKSRFIGNSFGNALVEFRVR
jgi:hypothetical protein